MISKVLGRLALVVAAAVSFATPAQARFWQCVTFAREVSGIEIYGNAHTWWSQAAGKYERGQEPRVGSVLAIAPGGSSRLGHVAMVSRIVSDREILLTHANWSRRGGVERDVLAVDVSPQGDWSQVKIWYAPVGGLGGTVYRAHGFIYGDDSVDTPAPSVLDRPILTAVATTPRSPLVLDLSAERAIADAALTPVSLSADGN